jgi:hypothetical protein
MHKKTFHVRQPGDKELIDMAFNKKKASERKDWLAKYEVSYCRHADVYRQCYLPFLCSLERLWTIA